MLSAITSTDPIGIPPPVNPSVASLIADSRNLSIHLGSIQRECVNSRADDHYVLLAVARLISHRVGMAFRVQLGLPQLLAGAGIESAQALVDGACDEDQSTRCGDGAALAECAGAVDASGFELVAHAKRYSPGNVAGVRVHGHQLSPWRRLARPLCGRVPEARVERSRAQRTEA